MKRRHWSRLVRVVREGPASELVRITGPSKVLELLSERASQEPSEVFYVIALGSQSQVIAVTELYKGILNSSLVHPREVFSFAIACHAAGIIVAHNHPSDDPTPSADDRTVTRQLCDAGRLLDIPVYDHVVLAGSRYASFAEMGLLV